MCRKQGLGFRKFWGVLLQRSLGVKEGMLQSLKSRGTDTEGSTRTYKYIGTTRVYVGSPMSCGIPL